jgi:hypothetical protein
MPAENNDMSGSPTNQGGSGSPEVPGGSDKKEPTPEAAKSTRPASDSADWLRRTRPPVVYGG